MADEFAVAVLDIKPIVHMNDKGPLEAVSIVRDRRQINNCKGE